MAEKIDPQIGRRIRSLRTGQNRTIDELAERAKITSKHLGRVERGTANPSIQCLKDIAAGLHLPVQTLIEADHELSQEELVAEIIALAPELSHKDAQIVYRLVAMLTNR